MKTAMEVADGFERQHRKRAHCLREKAYKEGFHAALAIIEGMFAPDLSEEEQVQGIRLWLKEMKDASS